MLRLAYQSSSFSRNRNVASSNSAHRESLQGPDERRVETSVRTTLTVKPHRGQPKHEGGETLTVGRPEARMGARLLGRAMLGRLVVAAINYNFVGTDLTGKPIGAFMHGKKVRNSS